MASVGISEVFRRDVKVFLQFCHKLCPKELLSSVLRQVHCIAAWIESSCMVWPSHQGLAPLAGQDCGLHEAVIPRVRALVSQDWSCASDWQLPRVSSGVFHITPCMVLSTEDAGAERVSSVSKEDALMMSPVSLLKPLPGPPVPCQIFPQLFSNRICPVPN